MACQQPQAHPSRCGCGKVATQVCDWHRQNPVTIYGRCIGCELERDRAALQEWGEKTDWFRRGVARGFFSATYLGKHIADAMSDEINRLRNRTIFVPCEQVVDVLRACRDELGHKPELLQAIDHILGTQESKQ